MKSGNEFLQQWQSSKNLIFLAKNKMWKKMETLCVWRGHHQQNFYMDSNHWNPRMQLPPRWILSNWKDWENSTTYVQRHNTNTYVYKRANEELNAPTEGPDRRIKPLTGMLELSKLKLLGHVLRRNRRHPWTSSGVCHSISITQRKFKS